jgi:hypothetical protein
MDSSQTTANTTLIDHQKTISSYYSIIYNNNKKNDPLDDGNLEDGIIFSQKRNQKIIPNT